MNASANLLALPSKFTLAVLAAKVVPRGSRGVPRRLEGRHFGRLWGSLGIAWDPLGTWDHFRIVLKSFLDHLGIFLGSFGDHPGVTFDYSEFGSRAQTPIIRTPGGRNLC